MIGKPLNVRILGAAVVDRAVAGEVDEIADAACRRDPPAELTITDLLTLDAADRLLHAFR